MCSGQRWVGVGAPGSPQTGQTQGWEPVAIKMTWDSDEAMQELAGLQKLQCALKQSPGHDHVIQLLDSYTQTEQSSGESWMYMITRWVAAVQHHSQLSAYQTAERSCALCCMQQSVDLQHPVLEFTFAPGIAPQLVGSCFILHGWTSVSQTCMALSPVCLQV